MSFVSSFLHLFSCFFPTLISFFYFLHFFHPLFLSLLSRVFNPFRSYVWPHPTLWFSCSRLFSWSLILSNSIFLPLAYSPALIYFGRERGWCVTCNYPTVWKEKNRNRKSTTCTILWLKSLLHKEKRWEQENHNIGLLPTWFSCSRRFSSCSTDFSQQIAKVVLFLFVFLF
jgi:hypothetical protein